PSSCALLTTVSPGVAASSSPTCAYTSSRSAATLKPVSGAAAAAPDGACICERVTETGWSGAASAPAVPGRSRSGGTSRGRFSGACAYSAFSLRNQPQPEVASTATASAETAAVRNTKGLGDIVISRKSGRECIAAGLFDFFGQGKDAPGLAVMGARQRGQRQAQPVADAPARKQGLDRNGIGLDPGEGVDRLQALIQRLRLPALAGARKLAQQPHR